MVTVNTERIGNLKINAFSIHKMEGIINTIFMRTTNRLNNGCETGLSMQASVNPWSAERVM
ncbi:MAG: hypothetical protein GVY07_07810 [Bacteroidetes bacterium]|jgi:hypothetical protein|nr:hypothetical protein [Bacteroidota bacterium]